MKNNKTKFSFGSVFKIIFIGIRKGLNTPTLPYFLITLQNKPIIRILRFLGGISMILIITHKLEYLGNGIIYLIALLICTLFSLIFTIYLFYINYYRVKYMIKTLKTNKLDFFK